MPVTIITREDLIAGIRDLAAFLESHPDVPVDNVLAYSYPDLGSARKATHLSGHWTKEYAGNLIDYIKSFEPRVRLSLSVMRSEACKLVQTGTRHVEAVPEHDEPVYGWDCGPDDEKIANWNEASDYANERDE
jgi:hypothetical protein